MTDDYSSLSDKDKAFQISNICIMFEVDGEQYEIKEYEVPLVDQTMFLLETLREKKVGVIEFKIKLGTIGKNEVMQIKKSESIIKRNSLYLNDIILPEL